METNESYKAEKKRLAWITRLEITVGILKVIFWLVVLIVLFSLLYQLNNLKS
jgi:hypothetical protein